MARRLDPATWPERWQTPAIAILAGAALLSSFLWPDVAYRFFWIYVPTFGALIWRLERARIRDIASWTVPLAIGLLIADRLPRPFDTLVSALGLAVLVAMLFWDTARDGWVKLVAPGAYRVFGRQDRPIAETLAYLDVEAIGAIERFTHDGNVVGFRERLETVTTKARGMSIADSEWLRVRDAFLDWLAACALAARDRSPESDAFDDVDRQRTAYEAAMATMADARAHLL